MSPMGPAHRPHSIGHGSCRRCPVTCDRVVHPAGCFERECPALRTHRSGGRTWIGCAEGVFRTQIDLERFRALQRTVVGFGGLRAEREPLPICSSEVQRTFAHREGTCVNPDFLLSDAPGGYRVQVAGDPGPEGDG
ncbi:MAG: hypothetical protein RJQ03_07650 [Miltoncostaeaceae bacterium]